MRRADEVRRIKTVGWVLGIGFAAAAVSQANVQVFGRDAVLAQATKSNRYVVSRVDFARRGSILSSDGRVLGHSGDQYELGLTFAKVPKGPSFFLELGAASDIPASEMQQMALSGVKSRVWRQHLSPDQARAIQLVKARYRADGVSLGRVMSRDYSLADAAACLIGRMNEGRPASGLELSQDKLLAGQNGFTEGLIDRTGAFLPMRLTDRNRPRVNGESITLTIDSSLQMAAANAIRVGVEANKADSGVAIIIEPTTGDILAMANWPTFDPTASGLAKGSSDFNPSIMGAYEPGSTFKILTLAKALDKGVVHPGDVLYCSGEKALNQYWRIHCDMHHGSRAHGQVNLEKAIAKSCNVCAATWALKVGYTDTVTYLEDLGLLSPTHLGLPLERAGMFNRNEYAKPLQLATVGFGQSVTATPVALASAFAMLANRGVRMEPRLIRSVGNKPMPVKEAGKIVHPEVAARVLDLMEAVIQTDGGTGAKLRIPGYRLAGKTGTAQKVNTRTGRVGDGGYVSSFVGVVPADAPKAVILVMVDNPKAGKYYGGSVAGPVFANLAQTLIRYFGLPPSMPAQSKSLGKGEPVRTASSH